MYWQTIMPTHFFDPLSIKNKRTTIRWKPIVRYLKLSIVNTRGVEWDGTSCKIISWNYIFESLYMYLVKWSRRTWKHLQLLRFMDLIITVGGSITMIMPEIDLNNNTIVYYLNNVIKNKKRISGCLSNVHKHNYIFITYIFILFMI